MKFFYKILCAVVFLIAAPQILFGQKVYSVKYSSQAKVKVFVVKYESQVDLCVYILRHFLGLEYKNNYTKIYRTACEQLIKRGYEHRFGLFRLMTLFD